MKVVFLQQQVSFSTFICITNSLIQLNWANTNQIVNSLGGKSSGTKNQRGESSGTMTWKTAVAEIVNGTQNTVQDEGDRYFCFRLDYLIDTFE